MKWKIVIIALLLLSTGCLTYSQKKSKKKIVVTGYVTDQSGQALSNVSIFLDQQNSCKLTDQNGQFKIKIKPSVKSITAFSVFYGGMEIAFNGQTDLKFILSHDFAMGAGAQPKTGEAVDIGYQTANKDKLTGSVGSVNKNRIDKTTYNTIYEMIEGEVAGVTVSGTSIRIRGTSSIRGSNEPLFIVDGSPVSFIDHISPRDVESIDILKGSAAAIYGTRGANGVIIIKLKGSNR